MKTCDLKPITTEEVRRTLRELFLRMDTGTKKAAECENYQELMEAFRLSAAMDKILDAIDVLGQK